MDFLVTASFSALSVAAFVAHRLTTSKQDKDKDEKEEEGEEESSVTQQKEKSFKRLQFKFFSAYFLALLGDWLQGPYVYQLYSHYGFGESQIALLFLTGFASSSTFGTFTGPLADKYGRKRMALVFAVVYGTCCLIKLSGNFWVLLAGRVLGGISTSLLFSVFESWYVKQHVDVLGLSPLWLSRTFSTTTFANGLLAILAGVVANLFAETLGYGPVAPFLLAVPCFVACFAIVALTWTENHGNQRTDLVQSYKEGFWLIWGDRRVLLLGAVQSVIESCMYIFVFLWTPVLSSSSDLPPPPLGLIFSSFMVAIMIGSSVFSHLLDRRGLQPKDTLALSASVFAACTLLCCLFAGGAWASRPACFLVFLVLEFSIGLYFPSVGCLRSVLIPESHRATVTNWYRVPMNLITCVTLLAVNHPAVAADKRCIFAACTVMLVVGVVVAQALRRALAAKEETKKRKEK